MLSVFDGHYFVLITVNRFCNQFSLESYKVHPPIRTRLFSNSTLCETQKPFTMDLPFGHLLRANSNYCIFLFAQEFPTAGFSCILTWLSSWVAPDLRC